jgi:hypothetical protein
LPDPRHTPTAHPHWQRPRRMTTGRRPIRKSAGPAGSDPSEVLSPRAVRMLVDRRGPTPLRSSTWAAGSRDSPRRGRLAA